MARAKLIFISGGVRSGKSAFAESLVRQFEAQRKIYLASGRADDAEMRERIERHRSDRKLDGWHTIEQAKQFERVLPLLKTGDAVLWDCVTTWLANELYEGWDKGEICAEQNGCMEMKWENMQKTLVQILSKIEFMVVVSNEILDDFMRDEQYMKWLGKIHMWLVQEADQAFEMENGIAFKRK
ncbi:bifunctional adenosylcobinamide kinase/adenosylcobinamide-phosphate guanylyltransferase [Planomicrobium sp. Y74]|uniref:bifunctional adenosylcobinamide kinase/adenosylcobinamide-phosphate guanylyltransferase n=1 Tax=Planomicrobium sp. Y74 TaxID=2478977 RepID=UPI000EF465A2|nr:bifunctional adenosylcobinamide kinase/adenosylcobinamide-phosphate guanylyltransferase [Planomicrobium sp. Y74]RLQ90542.1 cobinamide kinase [Planomicrobium sp. Y74]